MSFSFVRSSTFAGAITVPFVLLLAACASQPKPPAEADALPPPPAAPRVMPVEAEPRAPATQPASLFTMMTQGPVAAMLSYADKMRPLNGADLSAEISRIGDPGDSPATQMQLALLLSQTRVPADLARALGLLQRVIANPSPEAQPLHPLARALAARYVEQRRAEDDRDKQVQQLRDSQRRIDQLNDRIEALRAIERSFARPNMAPAMPAAPAASKPSP
ncbi:hypothetical protein SAMN05216567_103334 [Variovorax sp. OK605]|uniref:hypothetical protein n=1 Tax=Variovorax sp. OK605 TaxID=1855317 RepID=UPI0008F404AD|nr:hypothetical protein [Variovorax sp. OK605]SFO92213.1 hypothetical protein SAMN05216567_103334 [Variovorax sp. OK605]